MSPAATPETIEQAIRHLKQYDPVLRQVIKRTAPVVITPHKRYYQELVESIVSQQLSVKAAAAILQKFVDLFEGDDFPSPDAIIEKDIETFRSAGLSRQKAGYILDLAEKVIDGSVRFDYLDSLSNDEIITELTRIKGVGVWTVHMFLLSCMGRLDVLPVGDLGIRSGIRQLYNLDVLPSAETIEAIALANRWHPYESVASRYVWRSLDNEPAAQKS